MNYFFPYTKGTIASGVSDSAESWWLLVERFLYNTDPCSDVLQHLLSGIFRDGQSPECVDDDLTDHGRSQDSAAGERSRHSPGELPRCIFEQRHILERVPHTGSVSRYFSGCIGPRLVRNRDLGCIRGGVGAVLRILCAASAAEGVGTQAAP